MLLYNHGETLDEQTILNTSEYENQSSQTLPLITVQNAFKIFYYFESIFESTTGELLLRCTRHT